MVICVCAGCLGTLGYFKAMETQLLTQSLAHVGNQSMCGFPPSDSHCITPEALWCLIRIYPIFTLPSWNLLTGISLMVQGLRICFPVQGLGFDSTCPATKTQHSQNKKGKKNLYRKASLHSPAHLIVLSWKWEVCKNARTLMKSGVRTLGLEIVAFLKASEFPSFGTPRVLE